MTATVRLDSPTNSTLFTTCCGAAICDDQERCPSCGGEIEPRSGRERWQYAYGKQKRELERAYREAFQYGAKPSFIPVKR